jgi:asparagine synthase (glutamine-hydrolysing)
LFAGVTGYILWQRRSGPLSWRGWLRRRFKEPQAQPSAYPVWIQPELENRLELRQRFESKQTSTPRGGLRPAAFEGLALIKDSSTFFELFDPGHTRLPMEFRHPLMDLRIIEYCLSLPPYPWCIKKHILRESFRGVLPEPVRRRPKAHLAGHPHHILLLQGPRAWRLDASLANGTLGRYIDSSRIPVDFGGDDPGATWLNLRPITLEFWLNGRLPQGNRPEENAHGTGSQDSV